MDELYGKNEILAYFKEVPELSPVLDEIEQEWNSPSYGLNKLYIKFMTFFKEDMTVRERLSALIQASVELTTQEASDWEYVSARIYLVQFGRILKAELNRHGLKSF